MTDHPHRSADFLAFMASRQTQAGTTTPPKGSKPFTQPKVDVAVRLQPAKVRELIRFIRLRELAREYKEAGRPFTKDPIIRKFRFCNMRREDDRVTRWIATHYRAKHCLDPDLWFALCVARMALNSIDSMEALGYPVPWKPAAFRKMVLARQAQGLKIYGPAYMIATPNWTGPKHEFLVERLLGPLWQNRKHYRPRPDDSLASFHARLVEAHGVGSFTAAQVVADLKYLKPLANAGDWWDWAAPGPGSRRGLNRLVGRAKDAPWRDPDWLETLTQLRLMINPQLEKTMAKLHAQDLQNCLCEFDKYERVRLGDGTPKQLYVPAA
jgi:hypothetical protein